MAAYVRAPSTLTWLHIDGLINGLHQQINCKNCLYADMIRTLRYSHSYYMNI